MTDSERSEAEPTSAVAPTSGAVAPTSGAGAATPTDTKRKDPWDKAGVVASILSSVVLASVALFLNSTLQRTQIEIQKNQLQIQQTQLEESEHNERMVERTQNAKATTDLIQYLLSGDPAKQRLALIALRRAVQEDDDLVVSIVSVVASTSTDESLFREATETLQASRSPRVASILEAIAVQKSRKNDPLGTAVAHQAAQLVGVQAAAETGTTIIYGAPPGGAVFESSEVGGGVFTQSLISTLTSAQGPVHDGVIDVYGLSDYLNQRITKTNLNQPMPFVVSSGATQLPIWAPATKRVKALAIGVSKYAEKQLAALEFPTRDAQTFAKLLESHGDTVSLLTDDAATRAGILDSIDRFAAEKDANGTFVLYFAGHGWNSRGIQQLAAADMRFLSDGNAPTTSAGSRGVVYYRPREIEGSLALSDVIQHINKLPFRYKLVVIDACSMSLDQ